MGIGGALNKKGETRLGRSSSIRSKDFCFSVTIFIVQTNARTVYFHARTFTVRVQSCLTSLPERLPIIDCARITYPCAHLDHCYLCVLNYVGTIGSRIINNILAADDNVFARATTIRSTMGAAAARQDGRLNIYCYRTRTPYKTIRAAVHVLRTRVYDVRALNL